MTKKEQIAMLRKALTTEQKVRATEFAKHIHEKETLEKEIKELKIHLSCKESEAADLFHAVRKISETLYVRDVTQSITLENIETCSICGYQSTKWDASHKHNVSHECPICKSGNKDRIASKILEIREVIKDRQVQKYMPAWCSVSKWVYVK